MPVGPWLVVRTVIVLLGAVGGWAIAGADASEEGSSPWWSPLAGAIGGGVGVIVVLAIQAINPLSDRTWQPPSWRVNPFNFEQPLQFFHLAAWHFLAGGVACLAHSFLLRGQGTLDAFSLLGVGMGTWLGTSVSRSVFRGSAGGPTKR